MAFAVYLPVASGCRAGGHVLNRHTLRYARTRVSGRAWRAAVRMESGPPKPAGGDAGVETTLEVEKDALDVEGGNAVVVKPDSRLAGALTFLGGLCLYTGDGWLLLGYPVLILGLVLYVQTARIRFVFGPSKLNVASRKRSGDLSFIRGWAYDTIAVWDIYPTPAFPVLAYFREKESYGGRGSIHFFPIVMDGKQLVELFQSKTGRSRGEGQ